MLYRHLVIKPQDEMVLQIDAMESNSFDEFDFDVFDFKRMVIIVLKGNNFDSRLMKIILRACIWNALNAKGTKTVRRQKRYR